MSRRQKKAKKNQIRWLEFSAFEGIPFIFAGLIVKDSKGKSITSKANWKDRFEDFLLGRGFCPKEIVVPKQVHQNKILPIRKSQKINFGKRCADGILTNQKDFFLTIQVADCVPIYIVDPKKRFVGLIHAGWRGSLMQITRNAVNEAKKNFNCSSKDLKVLLGPAIGKCCYEVEPDMAILFPSRFINYRSKSKPKLDLIGFNRAQLLESGVKKNNIFSISECTYCGPDYLSSYRRDKDKKGRMLAFIGIR